MSLGTAPFTATRVPVSPVDVTGHLAAFIAATPGSQLSDADQRATCRAFANWVGCALGAAHDDSLEPLAAVARGLSGREQASVIGRTERLDVVNAALVNGSRANALDFDDMHVPTLIHPTGAVAAAAFAVAEDRHASGSSLLCAIATGIEVECRLGRALFPAHYDAGWHITATLGTLGAAAAASAILKLDSRRAAHALGIAATQASGLKAMLPNPCKSFNIGRAAASGVLAALLAEAGQESTATVFEERGGFFHVFGCAGEPAAIIRDLGTRYLVSEISLKPYPCGVVIHPLIDACLELARRSLRLDQVRSISITVHPRAVELAGTRHPATAIGGRFSLYHAAALAFTRRSAGIAAFNGADVNDPALTAWRELMTVETDARLTPGQAQVRIALADGGFAERAIEHASGSPQRPLSDTQLRDKFLELAQRTLDDRATAALYEECVSLARVADVAQLRRHWAAAGSAR